MTNEELYTALDSLLGEDERKLMILNARISAMYLSVHPELKSFHVSLGSNSLNMSDEDILSHIDEVDVIVSHQKDQWNSKTEAEKLLTYVETLFNLALDISDKCKHDVREMSTWNSGVEDFKSNIGSMIEMKMLSMNDTELFKRRELYKSRKDNV